MLIRIWKERKTNLPTVLSHPFYIVHEYIFIRIKGAASILWGRVPPDAHVAAELGAVGTQVSVPQLFHADKTPENLQVRTCFIECTRQSGGVAKLEPIFLGSSQSQSRILATAVSRFWLKLLLFDLKPVAVTGISLN